MDWKVLPFVHTFPGNDPSKTTWIDAHCEDCPTIAAILKKIPGLRIALLSRLGPNTVLGAHQVSLCILGSVALQAVVSVICTGLGYSRKPCPAVPPSSRSAAA